MHDTMQESIWRCNTNIASSDRRVLRWPRCRLRPFAADTTPPLIDIASIKKFVKEPLPSYEAYPDRLALLEVPKTGHTITDRMWNEGTQWLVRQLVEKPLRSPR